MKMTDLVVLAMQMRADSSSVQAGRSSVVRFGRFEMDLGNGELRQAGQPVKLQGQPFKVLALLVSNPGHLLSREDISRQIWGHHTIVDFTQGLNFCIKQIRAALGDDAKNPQYVETIPRRGYRFIVGVERKIMLAVLPFDNIGGDREQEYLSDGMTEELITQLGGLDPERLSVIARTSVMKYKAGNRDIEEIGQELGVNQIVAGSVRMTEHQLRITAHLIDAGTRANLWTGSYDRDLRDILSLEGEVASAIAHEIKIRLTPREKAVLANARPVHSDVYQLYLKGRYFWNKRSSQKVQKAVGYFQQAIAMAPDYAAAHAGLADCYLALAHYEALPPGESYPQAKAAMAKALELDDGLAEAHAAAAVIKFSYDWDWRAAEREYKLAIRLNPSYASAHQWYATFLTAMGRWDEAIDQGKRALELDPLSPMVNTAVGLHLYYSGRYREAIAQERKAIELEPEFAFSRQDMARAYEGTAMYGEAVVELERAVQLSDRSPVMLAALGQAYGLASQKDRALAVLRELEDLSKRAYVSPFGMAAVHIGLGDYDESFRWLEAACDEHSPSLVYLRLHVWSDGIRSDPRFRKLEQRIGLPELRSRPAPQQ